MYEPSDRATNELHDTRTSGRGYTRDYGDATLEHAVDDDLIIADVVHDRALWQNDGEGGVQRRARAGARDEDAPAAATPAQIDAAREIAEQARTTYEAAANQYALRLSMVAALLVRAHKPTASLLVFDQDEETVSADTTIEIVSVRNADGTDLGALDWPTNHEVCGLICTAYDSAPGYYPAAGQDTYDTENSGGQWQDRNLLELHIDILLTDRAET